MSAEASANIAIGNVNLGPGATAILGMNNVGLDIKAREETLKRCKNDLFVSEPCSVRAELINTKGSLTEGTCRWILHNETYRSWLEAQDSGLLWISGGPGKGKTMLSIFLTQEWESLPDRVLYVFCGDKSTNNELTIMRSLLYQVLNQVPSMVDHVEDCLGTGERTKRTLSSRGDLWVIFAKMLKDPRLGRVVGLIDGLDECNRDSTRWLLNNLRHVFDKGSTSRLLPSNPFRIAIVSRDMVGLRSYRRLNLETKTDAIKNDVTRVIDAKMKEHDLFSELDDDFIIEVKKTLHRRSDGTFLWVGFAIQELLSVETRTEMRLALYAIPRDLGALYTKILLRIKGPMREQVAQILHWVTLACQSLSVNQLAEALNVNAQTILDLVTVSGSLLTLSKGWYDSRVVVKLIHESVSDFLKGEANNDILRTPEFHIHVEEMELQITQRCLNELEALFCRPRGRDDIPPDSFSLHTSVAQLLVDHGASLTRDFEGKTWDGKAETFKLIHMVMGLGAEVAEPFLKKTLASISPNPLAPRPSSGDTALERSLFLKAASLGDERLIYVLFSNGATLDSDTALLALEIVLRENRSLTVMELILQHCPRTFNLDPLAVFSGDCEVVYSWVKLLLDHGMNPNSCTEECALLHRAVSFGPDLVELLLNCGARINALDDSGKTALFRALEYGNIEEAAMLLNRGADPTIKDTHGNTTFQVVIKTRNSRGLELLLQNGLDVNARDGNGRTALTCALSWWDFLTVEMLLEHGAYLDDRDEDCGRGDNSCREPGEDTGLMEMLKRPISFLVAVRDGCVQVVRLFLGHGADVNAQVGSVTPLEAAILNRHVDMVRVLLEHGADPNPIVKEVDSWFFDERSEWEGTPLDWNQQWDDEEKVQIDELLLQRGGVYS
ncbi:hypothetical protein CEP53_002648 [Fusarium sp. AF-6]|nr:hypothetical protein CEP53_002648 [Fusarium sp. AF-6]